MKVIVIKSDLTTIIRETGFRMKLILNVHTCLVFTETLYHRDDALLYIAYVMCIWAVPIPADG